MSMGCGECQLRRRLGDEEALFGVESVLLLKALKTLQRIVLLSTVKFSCVCAGRIWFLPFD
jgi:hypothetical protein